MSELHALVADLRWMLTIGKWLAGGVGAVLLAMAPLVVGFLVHVSSINSRMVGFEAQVLAISKTQSEASFALAKHADLPHHFSAGLALTNHDARLSALAAQIEDLKNRMDGVERER